MNTERLIRKTKKRAQEYVAADRRHDDAARDRLFNAQLGAWNALQDLELYAAAGAMTAAWMEIANAARIQTAQGE